MAKFQKPRLLSDKEMNIIRGKAIVGHASATELMSAFSHWDIIEMRMDEMDGEDFFGTEGWRHYFDIPEHDK